MTEEVSVEELQKQILEMKEANEKTAVEMQTLKDSLSKSEESLKAARERKEKRRRKGRGEEEEEEEEKKPGEPEEGRAQEERRAKLGEDFVDKVVAEIDAKKKKE